jgi:hypothetical protein
MAAPRSPHRNERRPAVVGPALAAFPVDAASVDLEPGATVSSTFPWAMTTLALLGTIAAAFERLPRGVRLSLDDLLAARLDRRRRTLRLGYV